MERVFLEVFLSLSLNLNVCGERHRSRNGVNLSKENRHCEARSAVAIQKMRDFHWSNRSPNGVNLTKENRHCEARSAAAIQKILD
jgi:hypothetical protein